MFKKFGFRQQLGLIFIVGMLLLALISTVVVSTLSGKAVRERLVDEGLSLTETFAEESTLALLYHSVDTAAEVAVSFQAFPDVDGVEIVDANHEPLYSQGAVAPITDAHSWPDRVQLSSETPYQWEFSTPVFVGQTNEEADSPFIDVSGDGDAAAELIGYVRVFMSKDTLRKIAFDIFLHNLLVSLGLAFLLLWTLLAVANRITKPLQNLARIMRQAVRSDRGEQQIRAELKGSSDIREMESAFNSMMHVLEGREEALRETRDQALQSARSKAEFAANVSHELRTPMNGVLGMLDLLSDTDLEGKQREFIGIAKNSAESLLVLIDDLLSFSKNEAGKTSLEVREFQLEEQLNDIIALLAAQAQRKHINLVHLIDADLPRRFLGDSDRLRQVLVNLVGNAIKFTAHGGVSIEVSLAETNSDGVMLRFDVCDTGLGITLEQQSRIFEAFSQADGSTTRKFGGTGLGLSISRQIVHLMGGEMGVSSEYGQGSQFWFTLPLLRCENESKPGVAKVSIPQGLRVLIVDNCEMVRRSLANSLHARAVDSSQADSYAEATRQLATALREQPFDLVLVDELLDGERGAELVQWVGDFSKGQTQCRLMVHRVADHAAHQGQGLLSKPLRTPDLLACIQQVACGDVEVVAEQSRTVSSSAPDQPVATNNAVNFSGRRILIVEDDRANQQVALAMLETMGCQVEIVGNGRECLEQVSRASYDLILMDCHMPELDGYKTTAVIREHESEQWRLPIVAMTANVMAGESDKCLAAGMDDYLSKPLSRDALRDKLLHWLGASPEPIAELPQAGDMPGADASPAVTGHVDTGHVIAANSGESSEALAPVLDTQVIETLRMQLGPALERIMDALVEDLPQYFEALQEALENEDSEALANVAHTIKGSAANVGARRLVAASEVLEAQARAGDLADAAQRVHKVQDAGFDVVAELKSSVPAAQPEAPASSDRGRRPSVISGSTGEEQPCVLIVDDDRGSRMAMVEVLRGEGYRVEEAVDGEQAIAHCEAAVPDLILMDAVMPNMDGFTACSLLKNLSQTKDVPVLIITALHDEASINKAFASGATDYIAKPVNFWVLSKRIDHLVQAHQAERFVHRLAYNDTLTGLPNRTQFSEKMKEAMSRPRGQSDQMAVLFLDLDRFKLVNDTLGHDTGDLLLKYFAERLQGCLRKHDVVARFGGDEFTILLDRVKSPRVVCRVAEKILEQLSQPFVFMDREMYVSTSIGIAMHPDHGQDIGTLLKSADMAMYRAKKAGDCYQFYESNMEVEVCRRLELENDLRGATEREEFVIFYQPQEDLSTGSVTTMEALVRWQHPTKGLVGPDSFIALAEETGQIIAMGEWILRRVCEQLQAWHEEGFERIRVSVNLSGKQITHPELVSTVAAILEETRLPAEYLELEITESTIMEDPEQVIATLGELKAMGLSLAIDDFGTGYSSLSYLRRFPIDVIKIDRSFVADIICNQVDADIVKTIIELAHILGVHVVAEGVETELQKALLKKQGCDLLQGYYLSRPVEATSIEGRFLVHHDAPVGATQTLS